MKKILLLSSLFFVFAFTTQKEKVLKVEFTQKKWDEQFNKIVGVRNYIDGSNLPHNDVKAITATIDQFLNDLRTQLIPQIDTVKKK